MRKYSVFAAAFILIAVLLGCSKPVGYLYPRITEEKPDLSGKHSGTTIQDLKPSLVIAASGCTMCHAQVHSNMVTNFGYGERYYFSQNTMPLGLGIGHYGDWGLNDQHSSNWGSASITGKIIVPKADVPKTITATGNPKTLADYLRRRLVPAEGATSPPEVIEYSKVYIGAPTKVQILNAANFHPAPFTSAIKYIKRIPQSPDLSGLEDGFPIKNNPDIPLVCDGDIIISNRTLYLNQLKLDTINGCNIYVAGRSVLIHGPITYVGNSPKRNLQITSSRSILMGLGVGKYLHGATQANGSDEYRLTVEGWSKFTNTHEFPIDSVTINQALFTENRIVAGILDASQEPWGRNIGFERLLLNAPIIHNRYTGNIKGTIIAEVFLGALGSFKYEFDPVFQSVPILPIVPQNTYLELVK